MPRTHGLGCHNRKACDFFSQEHIGLYGCWGGARGAERTWTVVLNCFVRYYTHPNGPEGGLHGLLVLPCVRATRASGNLKNTFGGFWVRHHGIVGVHVNLNNGNGGAPTGADMVGAESLRYCVGKKPVVDQAGEVENANKGTISSKRKHTSK